LSVKIKIDNTINFSTTKS